MNTTSSPSLSFPFDLSNAEVQEAGALIFVDDSSYEFVGGGMAANGL